jgi:hypothetical protein
MEDGEDFVKIPPTGRIDHGVLGKSYLSALKMMGSISPEESWMDG